MCPSCNCIEASKFFDLESIYKFIIELKDFHNDEPSTMHIIMLHTFNEREFIRIRKLQQVYRSMKFAVINPPFDIYYFENKPVITKVQILNMKKSKPHSKHNTKQERIGKNKQDRQIRLEKKAA